MSRLLALAGAATPKLEAPKPDENAPAADAKPDDKPADPPATVKAGKK